MKIESIRTLVEPLMAPITRSIRTAICSEVCPAGCQSYCWAHPAERRTVREGVRPDSNSIVKNVRPNSRQTAKPYRRTRSANINRTPWRRSTEPLLAAGGNRHGR